MGIPALGNCTDCEPAIFDASISGAGNAEDPKGVDLDGLAAKAYGVTPGAPAFGDRFFAIAADGSFKPISAAWQSWSPVLTQGVDLSYNNRGSQFLLAPGLVTVRLLVEVTSTGTADEPITCSVPVAASWGGYEYVIGTGRWQDPDDNLQWSPAGIALIGASLVQFEVATNIGALGENPPHTAASGDLASFMVQYRPATA